MFDQDVFLYLDSRTAVYAPHRASNRLRPSMTECRPRPVAQSSRFSQSMSSVPYAVLVSMYRALSVVQW